MSLTSKIKTWWRGKERPIQPIQVGNRKVIIAHEDEEPIRHWSSHLAHSVVSFYISHWKWLFGFVATLIGLYLAYLKL